MFFSKILGIIILIVFIYGLCAVISYIYEDDKYNQCMQEKEKMRQARLTKVPSHLRNCCNNWCAHDEKIWADRFKYKNENGQEVVCTYCKKCGEVSMKANVECEYFDPAVVFDNE